MNVHESSKRGRRKFSHNVGYRYIFDKHSKKDESLMFWRCENKNGCKGRIHTKNDRVVVEMNEHSHPTSLVPVEVNYEGDDDQGESRYVLSDPLNIVQLFQVATDMNLKFTYNSHGGGEYCFESNSAEPRHKVVEFADFGVKVAVIERINNIVINAEEWHKADWSQFLCAVRGKCLVALK